MSRRSRSSNGRSRWSTADNSRRQRQGKSVKGAVLVALALGVAAAVSAQAAIVASARDLDADLCRPRVATPTDAVVFVDPTDRRTEAQQRAIREEILRRARGLEKGGRLSLYALTSDTSQTVPQLLYSRCNPGDGSGESGWKTNKRMSQKRYDEEYYGPLTEAVAALFEVGPSSSSPLLEALHRIIVELSSRAAEERVLVVFSDLLEKSDVMSHYSAEYGFGDVEESAYVSEVQGRLPGAQVVVYRLAAQPTTGHQTEGNLRFWVEYLQAAGALEDDVIRGL